MIIMSHYINKIIMCQYCEVSAYYGLKYEQNYHAPEQLQLQLLWSTWIFCVSTVLWLSYYIAVKYMFIMCQ